MYQAILLRELSLSFCNKLCFENFDARVEPGSRIALVGRNGTGKSSLLKLLLGQLQPSDGEIQVPAGVSVACVEQTIDDLHDLSGGQRLNKRLSEVLSGSPDVLLLDEPTNHLDRSNRRSLLRMLAAYRGTLLVASHDTELLRIGFDKLWYFYDRKIVEYACSYDDFVRESQRRKAALHGEVAALKRERKAVHSAAMKEQKRAANSRAAGRKSIEQRKWPTIVSKAKALRAEQTSGKKSAAIDDRRQHVRNQLAEIHDPEHIAPSFTLDAGRVSTGTLLSITDGCVGYESGNTFLKNINLSLAGNGRMAVCGDNASGKSTLLKAIAGEDGLHTLGHWQRPAMEKIAWLDQHYSNLHPQQSVLDQLQSLRPDWDHRQIRKHLNSFLFRSNDEVSKVSRLLSGGEKARASLSLLAAKTPVLLLLDEVSNNLDLETKEHVVQVLREYPGALVLVSHEQDFIDSVGVDYCLFIEGGSVEQRSS